MKVEKYNTYIVAFGGTLTIVAALFIIISTIGFSFSLKRPGRIQLNVANNNLETEKRLVFGDAITEIDSDYVIIPEFYADINNGFVNKISKTFSSPLYNNYYKNYYSSYGEYNNLNFWNTETGKNFKIIDFKAIITQFYFPYSSENEKKNIPDFLLYGIIKGDSNKDGMINNLDEVALYISDLNGKDFKRISASGTSLLSWNADGKRKKIFFRVLKDVNKDGNYNSKDKVSVYQADIPTGNNVKEVNL